MYLGKTRTCGKLKFEKEIIQNLYHKMYAMNRFNQYIILTLSFFSQISNSNPNPGANINCPTSPQPGGGGTVV